MLSAWPEFSSRRIKSNANVIDVEFLYRALRPVEIARCVLIPKKQEPFVADQMVPLKLPITLGKRPEHAVRAHQCKGLYPTSGVSTTPHLERAEYYAQHHRTIAKIAVERLAECGIETFQVSEHVHPEFILVPEDDEVILVCPGAECLPKEIIVDIFRLPDAVTEPLMPLIPDPYPHDQDPIR